MWAVVHRELKSESRNPFSYWLRIISVGALLAFMAVLTSDASASFGTGLRIFESTNLMLFGGIWLLVPFATSDVISRERREGTLGLLYLTPLTSLEIILAKALAHGLRFLIVVLASLPVLAIPFLIGGVTWQVAAKAASMQLGAVTWAISSSLLASSLCKRLVPALLLGTGMGAFYAGVYGGSCMFGAKAVLMSSVFCFLFSYGMAAANTDKSTLDVPPTVEEEKFRQELSEPVVGAAFLKNWMRHKLERNPVGWLEQRSLSGRLALWGWLGMITIFYCFALSIYGSYWERLNLAHVWLLLILLMSLAMCSATSFRRERETGVLELLLVSPLELQQILMGRLRGIWAQFLPAFVLFFGFWLFLYFAVRGVTLEHIPIPYSKLLLAATSFLSIPVVGLYFSLRQKHLLTAFLGTVVLGIVIPYGIGLGAAWFLGMARIPFGGKPPGPHVNTILDLVTASLQVAISYRCFELLKFNLMHRLFALEKTSAN
jgi:ABC-type transport system involved in multi-copper enzyme maturation permease subunit